jgi:enediyne polyketide synthase
MACCYPGARSPQELWENVLAKRRAFRRIPPERLRLEDYFAADAKTPDSIYATEAAFIEGYEFDRVAFRVAGSAFREVDPVHWLALDVASQALQDAGFTDGKELPRESTGVVVGNSLTGEFSRAATLRLRWPYVWRTVDAQLRAEGWDAERMDAFRSRLETAYKSPFPLVGEETLAGGMSNTIAGRICNHFQFHGGGYTIDGACSSSLLAVANACAALESGDLDAALAGGVDLSLDPFELVGFSAIGALAHGEMRVYDQNPTGFLPGEGCGFVVLMRGEDALALGLRCYVLVRGWGISSDGGGGITRPEADGQRLAIRRAYRRAGYGIDTVGYFEGHGTGTQVGDDVELRTLAAERRSNSSHAPPAVIGTVKANIGHTKAAAGAAGLTKAIMALHTQVLPPNTGVTNPHQELVSHSTPDSPATALDGKRVPFLVGRASDGAPVLRVISDGQIWPSNQPLRAGVSAFGFGGINVHITLEGCAAVRRRRLSTHEIALLSSAQDAELFLLGAEDPTALLAHIEQIASLAPRLSHAELVDLAAYLANASGNPAVRAAVVASTPTELAIRLEILRGWLRRGKTRSVDEANGAFLGTGQKSPRIAFLFPGQASPVRLNGGAMARRFERVRKLYAMATLPERVDKVSTVVAQPAIVTAELAGLSVLAHLGVEASLAVGHSLGELTALHWAGVFGEEQLLRIANARGRAMNDLPGSNGAMASIGSDAATVDALLDGYQREIAIAALNTPKQTVISGCEGAVGEVIVRAKSRGMTAIPLPVSHAFHSALMAPAADELERFLAGEEFQSLLRDVRSTVTGATLTRADDLRALLKRQLTSPVRFSDALASALSGVDLCVEVGPGAVLTGLARELGNVPGWSIDAAGPSIAGLLKTVGAAYAFGMPIDPRALFDGRFTRPFNLDGQPTFFANPCELAPRPEHVGAAIRGVPASAASECEPAPDESACRAVIEESRASPLELVRSLVAQRAELPLETVKESSRLLVDLHLNSITVGQLAAEASRQLGLPPPASSTQYADATVGAVAQALQDLLSAGVCLEKQPVKHPAGIDAWVRPFTIELVERPIPETQPAMEQRAPEGNADWRVFASETDVLAQPLREVLACVRGRGAVVCLAPDVEEHQVAMLLQAARTALDVGNPFAKEGGSPSYYFVLVQRGATASSFAKTLHLEAGGIITCVIDLADDTDACARVIAEIQAASGYHEVHYDMRGVRREPRLRLLSTTDDQVSLGRPDDGFALRREDVLLVSGGGKGIAAECAATLAQDAGARLALLGRAKPEGDKELAANLQRLSAKGISFRYFSCDVSDGPSVKAAVSAAQAELGPVTAILHAAGVNHPRLLGDLTEADFERSLGPKLRGARNLVAAVDPQRLRMFVAFSSIIARTGMRGEADYALANEWLSGFTADHQSRHPNCRCLAIEWSVWSGVGMGERLGRIDALAREGISPISSDVGIAVLRRLVNRPPPVSTVVVTGRFGDTSTLKLDRSEIPFLRFLEQPRAHYPGIELVVDFELSPASDPYLDDHLFQGQKVFPAVMGLEAMAQAAMAVLATSQTPTFENVEFIRPIVVPEGRSPTLRIAALAHSANHVEIALRFSETGFQVDHFRAACCFEPMAKDSGRARQPPSTRISLEPESDLYGDLLFQRGRFQRLTGYRKLAATVCCADIGVDSTGHWFARYLPAELVYGDPGSRDAAIHAVQACIPHAMLLPTRIERLEPGVLHGPGPWSVWAQERWCDEDEFCYTLEVRCADGSLRERWNGLRLKRIADAPTTTWAAPLLVPYIERRVKDLVPEADFSVGLHEDPSVERWASADCAIRQALGQDVIILRRPDGKPETADERSVSAAHSGGFTLAVAGSGVVACDLESLVERAEGEWKDLLGNSFALAQFISHETGEPLSIGATRVWCGLECTKKAGILKNAPLTFVSCSRDGWVRLGCGGSAIACFIATLKNSLAPIVVSILFTNPERNLHGQSIGRSDDAVPLVFGANQWQDQLQI